MDLWWLWLLYFSTALQERNRISSEHITVQNSSTFKSVPVAFCQRFQQTNQQLDSAKLQRNILRNVGWDPLGARPSCHRLGSTESTESSPRSPWDPRALRPFVGVQQMLRHHLHMIRQAGQQLTSNSHQETPKKHHVWQTMAKHIITLPSYMAGKSPWKWTCLMVYSWKIIYEWSI